jgi:phenylpropionate dioxygenase-like ring-hydroxylating dioxygenase large terminal subunit
MPSLPWLLFVDQWSLLLLCLSISNVEALSLSPIGSSAIQSSATSLRASAKADIDFSDTISSSSSTSSSKKTSLTSLNQECLQSRKFPRTWVPLASTYELDPDRPSPLEFLGQKYVCYRDNNHHWVVMDDSCPHRLVPLSEGRVNRETNSLQCSYHGWEFNSEGNCIRIPQATPEDEKAALSSKRSCVTSYPVHIEKNVIWFWPWIEDVLSIAGEPSKHPETLMSGANINPSTYTRDLPYGWESLVENLIDPSHVPFAHHGLQGKREDAIPINMTVPESLGEQGFRFEWEDRTSKYPSSWLHVSKCPECMQAANDISKSFYVVRVCRASTVGMIRSGTGMFQAPFTVMYDANFASETPRDFKLSVLCIPTKPGWSRAIILGPSIEQHDVKHDRDEQQSITDDDDEAEKMTEKTKRKSPSLQRIIFKRIPVWVVHQLSNRFLDSDLAFLHYQEQERQRRDSYYMPAPSDRCIAALRSWIPKYTDMDGERPPPALSRSEMFDRWNQHTSKCVHCRKGLKSLQTLRQFVYSILGVSVLGFKYKIAKLAVLLSFATLRIAARIEKSFKEGEFRHYENH